MKWVMALALLLHASAIPNRPAENIMILTGQHHRKEDLNSEDIMAYSD